MLGIAAVAARVGQDIGADGHRLGLELLEAPVHPLRAGTTQAGPARRRFPRHHVGHVLLERQRVDRPRLAERVVERRQRATEPFGLPLATQSVRSPPPTGAAVGAV